MQFVFFTKNLSGRDMPAVADALRAMGADGADLVVRPGYAVEPANARERLPAAVKLLRDAGLVTPLCSAPTDLSNPDNPLAEQVVAACHDAGVPNLKIGYWGFRPGDYEAQLASARRQVDGWAKLADRYGVRICLHTHSGAFLGCNASAMARLVAGSDPRHIGVYLDTGHLAVCGEPPDMACAIAARRLALVAAKDPLWVRGEAGRGARPRFVPIGEGIVDWRGWLRALKAAGYSGPISVHAEFEASTPQQALERTGRDIAWLRERAREVEAES